MSLPLFYKDGFGIKWPAEIDIPLNKETETKVNSWDIFWI